MANVHGFRDLNAANQNQPRSQQQNMGYGGYGYGYGQPQQQDQAPYAGMDNEDIRLPFITTGGSGENPRKESFWDMMKYSCCPTISWQQFIVWVSILDVLYYLISLFLTWASKQGIGDDSQFLAPNINVLDELGERNTWRMKQGQVWRFITPLILHANLLHIFSNVIVQLLMVQLEYCIGTSRMIALYLISGIGGILFSSLINDNLSVGASVALMGLVAAEVGFMVVNWKALERFGFMRCFLIFQIIFMILITFMVGIGFADNIDNYGHLGGLLVGFFASMMLIKPIINGSYQKNLRLISSTIVIIFLIVGFVCFYTLRFPPPLEIDKIQF